MLKEEVKVNKKKIKKKTNKIFLIFFFFFLNLKDQKSIS
jgi:hypothetical protein